MGFFNLQITNQNRNRISIRGFVRRSVGRSVFICRSVGLYHPNFFFRFSFPTTGTSFLPTGFPLGIQGSVWVETLWNIPLKVRFNAHKVGWWWLLGPLSIVQPTPVTFYCAGATMRNMIWCSWAGAVRPFPLWGWVEGQGRWESAEARWVSYRQ